MVREDTRKKNHRGENKTSERGVKREDFSRWKRKERIVYSEVKENKKVSENAEGKKGNSSKMEKETIACTQKQERKIRFLKT